MLPRITIVTPSYNQDQFIEKAIRSVLLQGYPDLEYIVIDGGSSDKSSEIIRKYERWIAYWVSEKDRGQSHAINKGLAVAGGNTLCWLNSDDSFLSGALQVVGRVLKPASGNFALVGHCLRTHEDGSPAVLAQQQSRYRDLLSGEAAALDDLWADRNWRRVRLEAGRLVEMAAAGPQSQGPATDGHDLATQPGVAR